MAYLGKAPNTAIVNQATSQSFSGNGSTTAFTLTRSVNVGEDLEVFVNNVQQEPGSGKSYTASGTTLTFDEAPPSGTNNIYVIYRGEATINPRLEHDANSALAATTGTFSGAVSGTTGTFTGDLTVDTNTLKVDSTNNRVGVGTASPTYLIDALGATGDNADTVMRVKGQGTGDSDVNLILDSADTGESLVSFYNAGNSKANIEWSTSSSQLNIRTASGTDGKIDFQPNNVLAMRIDEDGYTTMPTQPIFFAKSSDNFSHTNGRYSTLANWSTDINRGSIFSTTTGKFTAPVDGIYQISTGLSFSGTSTDVGDGWGVRLWKNGSAFTDVEIAYAQGAENGVEGHSSITIYMDLNATDYVEMGADGSNDSFNILYLYFGGHLVG